MANIDWDVPAQSCLVGDMLLLASADTGQWSLCGPSWTWILLLISIYERFEPLYQDKGVCLKLDLPEASLPRIYGDENRLNRFCRPPGQCPALHAKKTQCHCCRIRTDR